MGEDYVAKLSQKPVKKSPTYPEIATILDLKQSLV